MTEMEPVRNPWAVFLLCVASAGLLFGLGVAALPDGLLRSVALWLVLGVSLLAIVGAVGWAYTEIRNQERLSPPKSDGQRILTYMGMLVFVALVAVGGAMIPSQFAHTIWLLYVPIALLGGWWLRRRRRPLPDRTRRR